MPVEQDALFLRIQHFPEKHLEVFDKVEDAISRAYAVKTDQHKYILLENDLPDNY